MEHAFMTLAIGALVFLIFAALGALCDYFDNINQH
jgi:hypothetical protein